MIHIQHLSQAPRQTAWTYDNIDRLCKMKQDMVPTPSKGFNLVYLLGWLCPSLMEALDYTFSDAGPQTDDYIFY